MLLGPAIQRRLPPALAYTQTHSARHHTPITHHTQEDIDHLFAGLLIRQWHIDPLDEPPPRGIVQLVGSVGGPDDDHLRSVVGAGSIQLHQELRLHAPGGLVLLGSAVAQQRVNLVDEDDGRGPVHRHSEQSAHESLPLADPLGGEGGCTYAEEGGAHLIRNSLTYQCLSGAYITSEHVRHERMFSQQQGKVPGGPNRSTPFGKDLNPTRRRQ